MVNLLRVSACLGSVEYSSIPLVYLCYTVQGPNLKNTHAKLTINMKHS